jgi:hypothetical protein
MSNDKLYKARYLKSSTMYAVDGRIGTVEDFYFDEITWEIRYLLSNPESCLDNMHRLVPALAIDNIQRDGQSILVELTQQQIENSPPLSRHQTVSRHYETEYYGYYGWPPYWEQDRPPALQRSGSCSLRSNKSEDTVVVHPMFTHIFSTDSLRGCTITSYDGIAGHVEDLVLDTKLWSIPYLQVKTRHDGPNKQILVSSDWVCQINMSQRAIYTDLPCSLIAQAPGFDPAQTISPEYEARLAWHYGNPGHWRYRCDSDQQ